MCEQLTMWRLCTGCKQRKNKVIRNINCNKVSVYKLGTCSNGMSYREISENVECSDCYTRRTEDLEADRKRRFKEAWPDPVKEPEEKSEEFSEGKSELHSEVTEDEDIVIV
ncbi:hypothetical protein BKA59DRAFT_449239 [Fusarium tricinctum]|uniref:Uncharacterized protein n=1 Tax=Fusarium tricinctum TaxID=61284 RepID=A0A8K0WIJ9_9HYPO|nr:hypothetical protein BKA59DRAFT_449239 [Fusarium tricinctum]